MEYSEIEITEGKKYSEKGETPIIGELGNRSEWGIAKLGKGNGGPVTITRKKKMGRTWPRKLFTRKSEKTVSEF